MATTQIRKDSDELKAELASATQFGLDECKRADAAEKQAEANLAAMKEALRQRDAAMKGWRAMQARWSNMVRQSKRHVERARIAQHKAEQELLELQAVIRQQGEAVGFHWQPDGSGKSMVAKLRNEVDLRRREVARLRDLADAPDRIEVD